MVKKLLENKFKTPTTIHLLRHQFNNWYGLFQIIFGAKALTTLEITEWIDYIDKHETLYDAGFKGDKDFGSKILGLVDLTFFQFCDLPQGIESRGRKFLPDFTRKQKTGNSSKLFPSQQTGGFGFLQATVSRVR
jgi:hypothetical protein